MQSHLLLVSKTKAVLMLLSSCLFPLFALYHKSLTVLCCFDNEQKLKAGQPVGWAGAQEVGISRLRSFSASAEELSAFPE